MKFECDSCHASYMIADEKVGKRGVKVKCKRCSHVIIVRPEKAAATASGASPPTLVRVPLNKTKETRASSLSATSLRSTTKPSVTPQIPEFCPMRIAPTTP
jgi:predicted Zn finger-like uncharacterized protein